MSSSGFRGRGFGLRGARSNGPTNGFNGPRFPHPGFNHPRPPHRLPGPDKWIERPNFMSWQQNKNFLSNPQYRGNLQFRPNSRGRAASGRGIVRFSGPGRPPTPQYCVGFVRNPTPRAPLLQEEQVDDKSTIAQHIPLLGSEEERQQKITETADKLKQKLSSITEEELTNFWEDDLSVLPNNGSEKENTQNKGIPELRHDPPELDLTFTDFKDIGRVDCSNSKLENTDDTFNNDEILITFEERSINKGTNNEIIIIDENKEESSNTISSVQDKDVSDEPNVLENSEYHKQIVSDLPNSECSLENLNLQCNDVIEDLTFSHSNDTGGKSSDLKEYVINLASIKLTDALRTEKSSDLTKLETTSKSKKALSNQDVAQEDISEKKDPVQIDTENTTILQSDNAGTKLVKTEQSQNDVQTNISQEESCQSLVNISDPSQKRPLSIPPANEEIQLINACDSKSSNCSSYAVVNKLNDDTKSNNSPILQSRSFNMSPRFIPRIQGPRCHWPFQQNGKNLFFHGSQRLPFHGNRMVPPRHITPFQPNDLVPVIFDPRAPPPFAPSVPVSSHDPQYNASFASKDFPLTFDPTEPPPNIRSKAAIESSNMQENMQVMPSLDSRNQTVNTRGIKVVQPHPTFDSRGPPPRMSANEKLPGFNPQQPPPKVHKRDETLQPPPIFDPRLTSQERSNLITPLDSSRSNIVAVNLMETSPVSDFNIASNFPQLPPMNLPSHQPYISNVQTNFQPILPQANNGQIMMRDFSLLPPPINITEVPLPPLKELSLEQSSSSNQGINMDDGLEDMQEAMEFAKQIMNMTEGVENEKVPSLCSKLPLPPSEIPIPNEDISHSSSVDEVHPIVLKKQKKKENRNKKCKQNIVCGPELNNKKQEGTGTIDKEQIGQNQNKNIEDSLLTQDHIRPKVVFNLNSKTKKIQKSEQWNRTPVNNQENKNTYQQGVVKNYNKEKVKPKIRSENKRNSISQDENQQKESNTETNSAQYTQSTNSSVHEQLNNTQCHQDQPKSLEKSHSHFSNNTNAQKNQKSRGESSKVEAPTLESTWKSRVINRFLKMSKNDICNMVNNSSLRKFDIAMKHLVKEKRPSLSLEMRNTEDEKMKEYDREEFMNQLNAMLDPGAVVGITDLPTEFIHHLSEVLQLDPMPFDLELPETQREDTDKTPSTNKETKIQSSTECGEDNSSYTVEELSRFSLSQENTNSSKRSLSNKLNPEAENTYKKQQQQQQPLFNEADLDDILSEVTDKTRKSTKQSMILSLEPDKSIKICKSSSLMQTVMEPLKLNTFLRIPNKTAADLDDIFSAGIARVRSHGKSTDLDNSRARKCSSEDRNTFRSERYERWNRKEQEDPDTFRNLTKEEWEAKYGSINSATGLTMARRCASNSAENLRVEEARNKESRNYRAQRYCSSDLPMRHFSLSPSIREVSVSKSSICINESDETRGDELTESSSNYSTTSSSDSDEETVSPNVTKLLKVIKEKEKIAKKRSLNETIRDEVAAEIEKKWKEKSKYKERKSRKRERRKRDRKERRKKERRKRRSRNSYSDTFKSSEHTEEFRLLAENEIKKEVVIKEEPVSTLQENIPFNDEINHLSVTPTLADISADLVSLTKRESQNLQIEKQQISQLTCDKTSSEIRNKPTVLSITVQPKTKAQLKQMPEFNNTQVKEIAEKTIAVTKNDILNAKDQTEKNKTNETAESNNERIDTVSPVNSSLNRINVSVNITEPSALIQPQIETNTNNNGTNPKLLTCTSSNPITEVNVNSRYIDQKIVSTGTSAPERKGSYKKIDIKAYKERALQRRLRDQAVTKENSGESIPLHKNLNYTSPISTTEIKTIELEQSKEQLEDPQLDNTKPANIPAAESSNQEVKKKINSNEKCENIDDTVQKDKESSGSVQSKSITESECNIKKKNTSRPNDSDTNTLNDSDNIHKPDIKSSSQDTTDVQKSEECCTKVKTLPTIVESVKFKNIRSEGGKEMKLKKEKRKRSVEKKKKLVASEKRTEKCVGEDTVEQTPSIATTSSTNPTTIEKAKSVSSNVELEVDSKSKQEDNVCSMTEEANCISSTANDNEQVTDQSDKKVSKGSSSLKNKKDSIKKIERNTIKSTEVSVTTAQPVLSACKELSVSLIPLEHTSQISIPKSVTSEKCVTDTTSSPDTANKESPSLGEKENLTTATTQNIQDTQVLKTVNENDNGNNPKNEDNNESVFQAIQTSSDYDKEQEAKSPNSPKSSFKGFCAESIKENIHQVSKLCNLKVNNKNDEENAEECSEQWLKSCVDNKSSSNHAADNESSEKQKEDNETSVTNLINLQSSTEEDNSNIIDNTEVDTKTLETTDSNIMQEQNERDISPMINTLSQDTFDEDNQPFIVLDEYIDDADEKSIEKLCAFDLDLEDCIARDADMFTNQHLGEEKGSANNIKSSNFNSIDFKDLSEVLDKNNDREENQNRVVSTKKKEKSTLIKRNSTFPKEFAYKERTINSNVVSLVSERNTELHLESQNSKSANSMTAISAKSPEGTETNTLHTDKISLHNSKLSHRESRTIEDIHTADSENDSQHNLECFNIIRSKPTSIESGTLLKLKVPAKAALRKSLENLSIAGTSLSETNVEFLNLNKQTNRSEPKNSLVDKSNSTTPSETKTSVHKDTCHKSAAENSRNSSKKPSDKSSQREENETLHKVKNKSKMKHKKRKNRDVSEKMIKEAVSSEIVEMKHPNTKEDILARMIEIDVEIHKLMTEKMTLYQMLTNDTLSTENNLQQNIVVHENKEMEVPVRPRTPPATNQCAKRSTEAVSAKDNAVNSVPLNISKTSNKQDHAEKKETCTSTCDSDEEEVAKTGSNRSSTSKKKKKHRSERTIKKLEHKSDNKISMSNLQEASTGKKQANEVKSCKKINARQVTEHNSSHNTINEIKSQEDSKGIHMQQINEEDSSNNNKTETVIDEVDGRTIESTESSKNEENCSVGDNENTETSNEKYKNFNSVRNRSESKTLEKSSIYSDDSTWDTVVQNSSAHNQKKSHTGLALLEETYRKEIAKSRKIKVETRKKKKKKMQNVPEAVSTLTPEEEELPLSALCAKKLHKKKKLLDPRDEQPEEINTDQQLWKNVVEVINAVAENRTERLYVEGSERQSSGDTGDIVPDIADVEKNSKSKLLEGSEDNVSNDLNKDNLQSTLSAGKLQANLCSEEAIQQSLETSVLSKSTSSLFETTICDSMSTSSRQEIVKDNGTEIEDSNINNIHNINNTSHIIKIDPCDEEISKIEELKSEKKDVNIKKDSVTKELSDALQLSKNSQNDENLAESNNCKNTTTDEVAYISEEEMKDKPNDSLVSHREDDTDIASQDCNYMSQNEYFINLKEQRGTQKAKASKEENNNKNWASVSLYASSTETLKTGETSSKRPSKRKRRNSKTPTRRSSRYSEEIIKQIKLETEPADTENELQDKNIQMTFQNTSHTLLPEKEVENKTLNVKKSKSQRSVLNKKRYRHECSPVAILHEQLPSTDEPVKEMKKRKQYTVTEMMNCEVRLVDCRHTILDPNVSPNILQEYGISKINSCTYLDSTQVDPVLNVMQLTSTKDLPSVCTKRKLSTTECPQSQPSKLSRLNDTQPLSTEINVISIENDNANDADPDVDVMPILTKEPVIVNVSQDCEKPDIEIVEEKTTSTPNQQYSNSESTLTVIDTNDDKELPRTQYTVHKGPILDIKVFENSFLAASEDGRIYRYNQASNGILNIYKGHKAAVTCLYVYNTTSTDISKEWMFSGSLDGTLRCYNITTGAQVRDTADIGSPIQCMDEAWGMIFIGTKSGHVSRYHIKSGAIKGNSIQFSDKSVLALKATNEGPRKVLIVASRSQPITIRDAQNGLFLRTICGQKSHTVYSLMRDNNLIYCGTSSTSIPVFDFTNGEQILQYDAGVGIVCMRLYKHLLFAGCYDGNIYVFNTKDRRLVCSIPGPGNMLLSMEVIDNKIIAGSKDKRLQSWQMPLQVRTLL